MYRDVVDVIEQTGDRLDLIMVPKVGTAADVYAVDMLVTQCEDAKGRTKRIGFEHIIETALGMANVDDIAAASKRNESLHFGVADYAASTKARTTVIGGPNPLYGVLTDKSEASDQRDYHWGDMWHYAIARVVVAARANGLRPIDGPFGDFKDPDGFRAQANRAAVLGCEGKWAIHPSQIDLANEVNSPSDAEITKAKRILEAMEKAKQEGLGAVQLDGRLIDIASIKQAEVMVAGGGLIVEAVAEVVDILAVALRHEIDQVRIRFEVAAVVPRETAVQVGKLRTVDGDTDALEYLRQLLAQAFEADEPVHGMDLPADL
jgi:malyl-CoA/(S)-citramalyl-CoA lyase